MTRLITKSWWLPLAGLVACAEGPSVDRAPLTVEGPEVDLVVAQDLAVPLEARFEVDRDGDLIAALQHCARLEAQKLELIAERLKEGGYGRFSATQSPRKSVAGRHAHVSW